MFKLIALPLTTVTGVRFWSGNQSATSGSVFIKMKSLTGCSASEGLLESFLSLSSLSLSFSLRFCSLSARLLVLAVLSVVVVLEVMAVVVELPSSTDFFSPSLEALGCEGFFSASALAFVCWNVKRGGSSYFGTQKHTSNGQAQLTHLHYIFLMKMIRFNTDWCQ